MRYFLKFQKISINWCRTTFNTDLNNDIRFNNPSITSESTTNNIISIDNVTNNPFVDNYNANIHYVDETIKDDLSVLDNERVNEFENDVTNDEDFKALYDKYVEFEGEQSQDINTQLEEVRSVTQQIL